MPQHDSPEGPLLDSIVADDESSITTHLRALGIASSGVIRGAVQFGSNQVLLPLQLSIMFPQSEAEMLGICIIIYGASKFCEPVYGLMCDHWVSPYGRRLPLYFLANFVVFISLGVMAYSVLDSSRGALYVCGFVFCMLAINISEVAYHGILADEADLRPRTHGILSGYKTAWFIAGAACVQSAVMLGVSTFCLYVAQMLSVPLFFCLSAGSMRVAPSSQSDPPFKLSLYAAIASYRLSPATHGAFFWVIVSYFFISAGLQWERFLYFFVRDCIVPSATLAKIYASRTYLVTLISCASGAIFYSVLGFSRRFGNRRCFVLGAFLISVSTFVLIFVETTTQLYIAIAALGASTGLMLSSSFALALEHIPHGHQESLSICLFRVYGSGLGHLVYIAPLLNYFGGRKHHDAPGFNRAGYTAILLFGAFLSMIGTAVTHWKIKETAPSKH